MTEEWFVYRSDLRADRTLGGLWFVTTNPRVCHTLEDPVRPVSEPKVPGQTALYAGRYRVDLTWSNRFGRLMTEILKTPRFVGTRFHPGETPADTEGCPLIGLVRDADAIHQCKPAEKLVNERVLNNLRHMVETWCTFVNGPHPKESV